MKFAFRIELFCLSYAIGGFVLLTLLFLQHVNERDIIFFILSLELAFIKYIYMRHIVQKPHKNLWRRNLYN
jgi:hypothetical protein